MIIPLSKIVSCSSEHPDFPASNLLKNPPPGPWKCENPGVLLTYVIFKFTEEMCITALDIANYRSCIVIVTAATEDEPDTWVPIVNHQFLTHDEAANNKFRDQVQLFTKKELNSDTLKIKFSRAKITCMQSANTKILFGLSSLILRGEAPLSLDLNILGRFKLKDDTNKPKNDFKAKFLRLFPEKQKDYREEIKEKIKETGVDNFNKRQEEGGTPKRRPLLEKLEAGKHEEVFGKKQETPKADQENAKNVKRTPFGDIIPDDKDNFSRKKDKTRDDADNSNRKKDKTRDDADNSSRKKDKTRDDADNSRRQMKNGGQNLSDVEDNDKMKDGTDNSGKMKDNSDKSSRRDKPSTSKRGSFFLDDDDEDDVEDNKINGVKLSDKNSGKCSVCVDKIQDRPCGGCGKLPEQKMVKSPKVKKPRIEKPKRQFSKLLDDVSFSLSGYVNPQRDEIRRKALKMGARYVADPNITSNKCTHLICAFRNTPKSQQLKGHAKILSHLFIEECFDNKKRFPWRRYAMDKSDRKQPESEDEIEGTDSPVQASTPYEQPTDPESEEDY